MWNRVSSVLPLLTFLFVSQMTETQISQMELERTAENFRRLHDERQNLLQQWETAIQTMKKRDEEVEERQQYYQQLRDEVREKQALVDERERQLEEQNEANEHAEKQVLALERMLSKYKSDQVASKTELNNFQEELEMLKKTLHKSRRVVQYTFYPHYIHSTPASQEIATNQSEIANLNADLDLTKAKLQEETDRRAQAERRLEAMRNGTTTLEQKNAQLVELVRQDEAKSKELDREIKAVREIRRIGAVGTIFVVNMLVAFPHSEFRCSQEVKALKATEKSLAIDIVSTQKALKNLKSKASR